MKIGFVVEDSPPTAVYTWSELEEWNSGEILYSKEFFLKLKCLERNIEFVKEIKNARGRLGIHENGLTLDRLIKRCPKDDEHIKLKKEELNECNKIESLFHLDDALHTCLRDILIGDFVFPDDLSSEGKKITHTLFNGDYGDFEEVVISIKVPVKKHFLLQYIKRNWKDINEMLSKIKKKTIFKISERDLEIYDLKVNENLSYSKIADQIIEKFKIDDPEGHINPDSVKTAFNRVKEKIESTASYRM